MQAVKLSKNNLRQRGYTLVEIAIVMTTLIILVGGMAWPFAQQIRSDEHRQTKEYMELINLAIVNYAATNQTQGNSISYRITSGCTVNCTPSTFFPGGRPYLPCPDIDGDGFEDRFLAATGFANIVVPINPINISGRNSLFNIQLSSVSGRCLDDKGLLPYKTINSKPADPWGNRYTYWVDSNFSNQLFGFDQNTKASRIFKYAVYSANFANTSNRLSGHYIYPTHLTYGTNAWEGRVAFASNGQAFLPGAIVTRNLANPCTTTSCELNLLAGDLLSASQLPTTDSRTTTTGIPIVVHEYGSVSNDEYTGNPHFFDMANGIAFVVASTGANGFGGTRYIHEASAGTAFSCIGISESITEQINSLRSNSCITRTLNRNNCVSTTDYPANCTTADVRNRGNGIFVYSEVRHDENDDLITWLHPNQLIIELTNLNILPVDLPPVVEIAYQ